MKSRRRVEIRVERHELTIFAGTSANPAHHASPPSAGPTPTGTAAASPFDHAGTNRTLPDSCPICGAVEMVLLAHAIALTTMNTTSLKDGLEAGRYHLHCSGSGEWWVCGQSLQPG